MGLKMSSEIENRSDVKAIGKGTIERYFNLLCSSCRLDHVVCEMDQYASFRRGAAVRRAFRNSPLAGKLIEILNDIKTGKADPSEDDKDCGELPPHGQDHSPQYCRLSSRATESYVVGFFPNVGEANKAHPRG